MHSTQEELLKRDHNICAQTWHSVLGFEQKHGLELSSPHYVIIFIDIQEYRSLMSSSPYRRVTDEIENGNLAMVLATDIQYIGYKGLGTFVCVRYVER